MFAYWILRVDFDVVILGFCAGLLLEADESDYSR